MFLGLVECDISQGGIGELSCSGNTKPLHDAYKGPYNARTLQGPYKVLKVRVMAFKGLTKSFKCLITILKGLIKSLKFVYESNNGDT